jgi:serine phosphatase RsbU (regulator of sigma subunit)
MFRAALGRGEGLDGAEAARLAVRRCKANLDDAPPLVALIFSAAGFDHAAILGEIRTAFPDLPLAGCSSDGQIASGYGLSDDAVDLLILAGDGPPQGVAVGVGAGENASGDPVAAADAAVASARKALIGEPVLALAFSDAMTADALMARLARKLGGNCPVFGGAAGCEEISGAETRQFVHDRVLTGGLVLVLLGGNIRYSHAISNSWTPIGPEARVAEVRGRDLLRIDDRRALDFYRHYLGPHSEPAIELPLAVFEGESEDAFYIRGPISFEEDSGAVSLTGAIPAGARIRLTEATRAGILSDTRTAAAELVRGFPDDSSPAAALLFSCANRRRILGTRTEEELTAMSDALPDNLPAMGFHTFGEFAPLGSDRLAQVHNCTLVSVMLGAPMSPGKTLGAPLPPQRIPPEPPSGDPLTRVERRYRFQKVQLARSERERNRLERLKETNTALLRRVNDEVNAARLQIEKQNRVLRQALSLAQEVQQSLLPHHPPRIPGFDIAGRVRYQSEAGGDYFDFLQPSDPGDAFSVVVGDVSGHGVAAALLMTAARALLRSRADRAGSIAEIVSDINRLLTRDISDSGRFMTLFFLHLDAGGRWMRWVRAGHDPAFLIDPAGEEVVRLGGEGMALGVDRDWNYAENARPGLASGQFLIMGTDGLWEARNPGGEMFGKDRVIRAVRNAASRDAEGIADAVFEALESFLAGEPPEDDMTLVVVRRKVPGEEEDLSVGLGI